MTAIQYILGYLHNIVGDGKTVASHHIEISLCQELAGRNIFINPGTLSRKFRLIRENAAQYGISFTITDDRKERTWKFQVIDSSKLHKALSPTEVAA